MTDFTLYHVALAFGLGAVLLPRRQRAISTAALVTYVLGAAALTVTAGAVPARALGAAAVTLGTGFARINAVLLVAGSAGAAIAAAAAWRGGLVHRLGGLIVLSTAMVAAWALAPLVSAAGVGPTLGAALSTLLIGAAGLWVAHRSFVSRKLARFDWGPDLVGALRDSRTRAATLVILGTGTIAVTAPNAAVAIVATFVAALAAQRLVPDGAPRVPALPALALLLVPVLVLAGTIAGPTGLSIATLSDGPFSPAAERILVPPIALAAWGWFALWPLHRVVPGPALAWIGGALMVRIAVPAFPLGVEHWQPLLVPLGVVAIWHGAVSGRRGEVLAGIGWIGAVLTDPRAAEGVAWVLGAAALLPVSKGDSTPSPAPTTLARAAMLLAAGWGALLVLDAGLRAEVVYSTLAALGVAAACLRAALERPPDMATLTPPEGGSIFGRQRRLSRLQI